MNSARNFGLIFTLCLVFLNGCNTTEPDGKWDDNIHLSSKSMNIPAETTSVLITTQGTSWWLHGIGLDDDWSFDFSDVDTLEEDFLIEEDEFTIERRNATEIHITMRANTTNQDRELTIGLQAGNYFDAITITQAGNQ